MAKIVIIAPADTDLDDAVKLLKGAGNDVDTEEPTPKALLHIVMGLLSANAYGFGPEYAVVAGAAPVGAGGKDDPDAGPGDSGDDDTDDADAGADDDTDVSNADFNFESVSLGNVMVDGVLVEAIAVDEPTSKLKVENLTVGPRTIYTLHENRFSFWPGDETKPIQQIELAPSAVIGEETKVVNVEIAHGDHGKPCIEIGADLACMFEAYPDKKAMGDALRRDAMQTPDNKKQLADLKAQVVALQKDKTKDNTRAVLKLQAKINKLLDANA